MTGTVRRRSPAGSSPSDGVWSVSSTVPIESAFELDVDGERYTIGGTGAFLEDFEAESVTVHPLEE